MNSSRDHAHTASDLQVAKSHTKGPWIVFDRETITKIYSIGNQGALLADVHSYTEDVSDIRPNRAARRANARLIAAAPDLLVAAKRALNVLKATGESVRPSNALGALEAAISKAEGK